MPWYARATCWFCHFCGGSSNHIEAKGLRVKAVFLLLVVFQVLRAAKADETKFGRKLDGPENQTPKLERHGLSRVPKFAAVYLC